jgi:hypothetical protein
VDVEDSDFCRVIWVVHDICLCFSANPKRRTVGWVGFDEEVKRGVLLKRFRFLSFTVNSHEKLVILIVILHRMYYWIVIALVNERDANYLGLDQKCCVLAFSHGFSGFVSEPEIH